MEAKDTRGVYHNTCFYSVVVSAACACWYIQQELWAGI